jgi:RNA polymerase sigma-70 factor (ECF subfamily)
MPYSLASPGELIRACAQSTGETAAWGEFIRRYNRQIVVVAFRTAQSWGVNSSEIIDDLVQETYLKICADHCKLLRQFVDSHPGSIFGYLKAITASVVHDRCKSLHTIKRGGGRAEEGLEVLEVLEIAPLKGSEPAQALEREILLDQIDTFLQSHIPKSTRDRDLNIFWLYYRQGLTAQAIASLPATDLTAKGVESTILRLTRLVRSELLKDRTGELRTSP